MKKIKINNNPDANELWSGIGGNFDSLSQIICEFVDNSISNFVGNNCPVKNIIISIEKLDINNNVNITIEDSGTGIKNLDESFTLGSKLAAESTYNEHGFGMKHALASANPENDSWAIYTRTKKDFNNGVFKKITSPYKINNFEAEIIESSKWPKYSAFGNSGTIIEFNCYSEMFTSLSRGITGGVSKFETFCDILFEDLSFIYSNILKQEKANITLRYKDLNCDFVSHDLTPLEPKWTTDDFGPGEGVSEIDLGGGTVAIKYHFGHILDSRYRDGANGERSQRTNFDNNLSRKYYANSLNTQGVEIRFNGRIMCYNLVPEIWGIAKHNVYNDVLITIDIETNDINALPSTRTSKNGIREGDVKLNKLYEWIKGYAPQLPKSEKEILKAERETAIFERLKKEKETHVPDPKVVKTQQPIFINSNDFSEEDKVLIDLYMNVDGKITIYEGKKDKTKPLDVYQLRMYWDGLVHTGQHPYEGILISKYHTSGVKKLIQISNEMKDQNGNNYNFKTEIWEDENLTVE